jgi:uncharacterized membrane-anchored protein
MRLELVPIIAWVAVLVASVVGLALKDVRLHGVSLFVALAMVVLALAHH